MAILWVASDWPMHDLSERYLYSVHMTQHLLFTLVAAPLLVVGIPVVDVAGGAPAARRFALAWRSLTRPVPALVVFNGVLLFTHWPAVVTALGRIGAHALRAARAVVGSALVMWWPVVSPLPELPPITPPGQMLYLFLQSLAPTIPASFLTFGTQPLYPVYATFPRIWGIGALDDQLMAGLDHEARGRRRSCGS